MRAPVSWIRDYVELPAELTTEDLAARLTDLGLKLEAIHGADIKGPLVVGRVLSKEPEPQKNGKTINWCSVDVGQANGTGAPQGIVCGAHNFEVGDLVVCVLPGATLPGGFEISARKTYGHISAGMICSATELGLPEDDADGIVVLPAETAEPGTPALGLLGLDDDVIEFEINPDRAYAMSLRGVAREAALGFEVPFSDPAQSSSELAPSEMASSEARREIGQGELRQGAGPPAEGYPVEIEAVDGCPVFVARRVHGFDPTAPTPSWMKRRLQQVGQRPISLAVDVTNYVMFELGRPIHAYDADKLQGSLGVRRARAGESLETLDGTVRELSVEDLVVTDETGAIGLGGVMGGLSTEITDDTREILVESAHWEPRSMFRTGRRQKLTSEAGKRNERGVDPLICMAAADRVVELLVTHGGGTADPAVTVVGAAPCPDPIRLDPQLCSAVSGLDIPEDRVVSILTAVGCLVTGEGDLSVRPPSWRADLQDPYDLVEEVVRVVGYDNVPSVLPHAPPGRGLTLTQSMARRLSRATAALGFVEVINFPFVGESDLELLGVSGDQYPNLVRLENPLSAEAPYMTPALLPGVLSALARNVGRGIADPAVYEVAQVTANRPGKASPILGVSEAPSPAQREELFASVPNQPLHLAFALCGQRDSAGWWGAGREVTWADAVHTARQVAGCVGVEIQAGTAEQSPWHPGRCAELMVAGQRVGHAGELHPRVCEELGLPARTAAAELDLSQLIDQAAAVPVAPSFSTLPVAKEDVALVVDEAIAAGDVEAALARGAGRLCESVRLFDVYRGEQVGAGKKSLAFSMRFRAMDHTLTDAESAAARDAAVARATDELGAEQRI